MFQRESWLRGSYLRVPWCANAQRGEPSCSHCPSHRPSGCWRCRCCCTVAAAPCGRTQRPLSSSLPFLPEAETHKHGQVQAQTYGTNRKSARLSADFRWKLLKIMFSSEGAAAVGSTIFTWLYCKLKFSLSADSLLSSRMTISSVCPFNMHKKYFF